MRKRITIFLIGILALPFLCEAASRDTTPWQRDVRPYRQRQKEKREDYKQYIRQQNSVLLKAKLAKNNKLGEQEKEELITFFQSQYKNPVPLNDSKYAKDLASFEKIANDPGMGLADKKTAIKAALVKEQKDSNDSKKNKRGY